MHHNSAEHDVPPLGHLADPHNSAGEIFSDSDCECNSQRPQINLRTDIHYGECYNTQCREDDIAGAIGGGRGGNAEETEQGKSTPAGKVTIVSR